MKIAVHCANDGGEQKHFWQSTGLTPASLLLNADMRQNMIYAGSIPHGGITFVRIHYLLELVKADGLGTDNPVYNWSILDNVLNVLIENELKPFFELMGNPEGYFTDYLDDTQAWAWRRLVHDLARHYIDRYGMDEVRSWSFETWNEPDVGWWTQSEAAFCVYYDACLEGLQDADPQLVMGGPGTARTLSNIFKAFVAHCDSGENYFTGEQGVRVDFISVHEKGVRSCKEDLNPSSMGICDREIQAVDYIRQHHPRLADVPLMNNECDPQVGWLDYHTWRGRSYYAAFVCKMINQHQMRLTDGLGVDYKLLSNDNGFVGEWGHRTLLARFSDFEDVKAQSEHRTKVTDLQENPLRRKFEMLKKPVLNVMALLALLGDRRCEVTGSDDPAANVGVMATRRGDDQVAVLVYNSQDRIISCGTETIELSLDGLPFEQAALAHYRIDETHSSPYDMWEAMGAPRWPSASQYAQLRQHQEPTLLEAPHEVTVENGQLTLTFDLPLHGVSLLVLSARPAAGPGSIRALRYERYAGLTDNEQVMLIWKGPDSRVIRTFEVLYAQDATGPFQRVNEVDTICTAYLHVREPVHQTTYYKIRTVDYWGRSSESDVIEVAPSTSK